MPGAADYENLDGLALAERVRRREVSPAELVEAAIARIEKANPRLNAVVHKMYDIARAGAKQPLGDGPFAGVPFLIKDLLDAYAGQPMSSGSRLFAGWSPAADSEMMLRYKRAGFLVVGKTNTPEFGLTPVTESEALGPARNPWNPERTPGGSSGGSAVAVAAGMVPIASGGDGGGSLRIPASCCGVFGLKPTRARTPAGPFVAEVWQGFAQEHVITRSVRDSAAVLDATHGSDPGEPYCAPRPARPFREEVGAPPGKLRIAWTARPLLPAQVHPDCVAAVQDAAKLCASLGHEVEEAHPELNGAAFARDFVIFLIGETAAEVREAERLVGRKARHGDLEPGTAVLHLLGDRLSAADYAEAVRNLKRTCRTLAPFFARYDVLVTPTVAKPPLRIGELLPQGAEMALMKTLVALRAGRVLRWLGTLDRIAESAWSFIPFTPVFNVTGQPAMSVPLYWNAEGLPIGTQFVGRFGDEATLFRLAAQLEQARPWQDRRPPVPA